MIDTALAQLRFVASVGFGVRFAPWSLDRLAAGLLATQQEFGGIDLEGQKMLGGPQLDPEGLRSLQSARFRRQAKRAAEDTEFYGRLFRDRDLDPTDLRGHDFSRIPTTSKAALREDPDDFIARSARPYLRCLTTGTTGRPTAVSFSWHELQVMTLLSTIGMLVNRVVGPEDVVHVATSARALLGNLGFTVPCERVGANVQLGGVLAPERTLAMLAEPRRLPGKKPRASVMNIYPSYLGELVECGLAGGYRPEAFGLECVLVGGEIVTEGLKARAQELFGPLRFVEGYAMSETYPTAGNVCSAGHLHFEASQALIEVLNPDTGAPCGAGEVGSLVVTPLPPYRETTLLLRYDTEDLVQVPDRPPDCEMRHMQATSNLLGKLRLSTNHGASRTCPRQVLEALERLPEVPLPARAGFWAVPGGVAVEVLVRADTPAVRTRVEASLAEHGVPVRELRPVTDRRALRQPLPLRCDLREVAFN